MLLTGRSKQDIFRVPVVFDLSLLDVVDKPPSTLTHSLQHNINIPVSWTVGEECTQASTSSTVDANDKCKLYSVEFRYETKIILRPKGQKDVGEIMSRKVMLRSTLVHH